LRASGTRAAPPLIIMKRPAVIAWVLATACVHATTAPMTSVASSPSWTLPGTVESVRLVAHRIEGDPRGGAFAGALIGGLLFAGGGWTSALFGAFAGAGLGAIASPSATEYRSYQVIVRLDDGTGATFLFHDVSPFVTGQRVALTPRGLLPITQH
jgi:outer membrane lipoprotein SlyB